MMRSAASSTKLVIIGLPLMAFAMCFTTSSAAAMFEQAPRNSSVSPPTVRRVVGRGRLTGTRELQQVVTWRTSKTAHLAIETTGSHPRVLWQASEPFPFIDINSVRVNDIDSDGVPEIVTLWWKASSPGAALRVFHWDRGQKSFVELPVEDEPGAVLGYRVARGVGTKSSSRIAVYVRSHSARRSTVSGGEYEMRGAKLVLVGGGKTVPSKSESGIEGQAVISPVRPGPIRQGMPNTAPHKTTLVVLNASDDREVARFETGADGRFRVALPPGTYRVGAPPQSGRFLPRAAEETVTVIAGKFAPVTIHFDSGMR